MPYSADADAGSLYLTSLKNAHGRRTCRTYNRQVFILGEVLLDLGRQ